MTFAPTAPRAWFRTSAGALAATALLAACGGGGEPATPAAPAADSGGRKGILAAAPPQGRWAAPVALDFVPAAAAQVANGPAPGAGSVVMWSAENRFSFSAQGETDPTIRTWTATFDAATGTAGASTADVTGHNMFCPGTANLADGRILVTGGSTSRVSSIYDPATRLWSRPPGTVINIPRAYQATVPLRDGSVFMLGGSWNGGVGNKGGEVWNASTGWRALSGVPAAPFETVVGQQGGRADRDYHQWLLPAGNGRIFHAGPSSRMNWIDPRGAGGWTAAGTRGTDPDAVQGSIAMFEPGRILVTGGARVHDAGADPNGVATANAHLIDITSGTPVVTRLPDMAFTRVFHNSVVLPNGQVMVIGGRDVSGPFNDTNARLTPELFDPASNSFVQLPALTIPRTYHSWALLLPDARVLVAGGGLCNCAADRPNYQLYSPHYLFNPDGTPAPRPQMTAAPTQAAYGGELAVTTDVAVASFALVRKSSVTHTVNNDQRRIPLSIVSVSGTSYRLAAPVNPGWAMPGDYMLFAIDARGVPSLARTVRLGSFGAPLIEPVADQSTALGAAVSLQLAAGGGSGTIGYAATGLPPGVVLDAASGRISGAPGTAGRYLVTVFAGNDTARTATEFAWDVGSGGGGGVGTAPPPGAITCAGENQLCTLPAGSTATVWYGADTRWASRTGVTGSIACNNATFGDPAFGIGKTCVYELTGTPPVPVVIAAVAAPIARAGASVSYTATATGVGLSYSWDFGDGSAATPFSASATASKVFASPGVYGVTLTVRSTTGTSATRSFLQAVASAPAAGRPGASSAVALETRAGASARLWVANPDHDTVAVIDTATNARVAEIAVGVSPRSVAVAPDGRVWVTNKGSSSISILSPTTLAVATTVALPRAAQPHGLAFAQGGSAFVVLEATGQLLKLDPVSGARQATLAVGPNPRHVSTTPDGTRVLVSRFITSALPGEGTAAVDTSSAGAEVVVVNAGPMTVNRSVVLRHSDRPDTEAQGAGIPNYLAAAVVSPDGTQAWVPSKQDNLRRGVLRNGQALTFQNTVRAISSRIDLATLTEDPARRVDHDNASLGSAAAYHPSGAYLFVALETSRQVAVMDPNRGREVARLEVGRAPQALALAADGRRLYVQNFMDRTVSVVDLVPLVTQGRSEFPLLAAPSSARTERLSAQVLLGKQLFYDARDPRLSRDSYMSCATCHSDAGHDGRTWDFTSLGEGLRNTPALVGRAGIGQGFQHWSANFDEVQDFEGQIRSLAGGTGLMTDAQFNTGTRNTPLGDRKTGLSADLDALAAYLASLNTFERSPGRNADGTLSAAALAGRTVFVNANCASCHGGAGFTGSADGAALRDIGTLKPASGQRLGAPLRGIDVPTLRDVWKTAPYLHDGSAPTLAAAVQAHAGNTIAGTDLSNLVAYLRQIGSEEATAPAPANRPPTVSVAAPASVVAGTAVTLTATAADADGTVARVEFFAGTTLLGTDTTAPYALGWTPTVAATVAVTARAVDNAGAATTSAAVTVAVAPAPPPPASAVSCATEGGSCTIPAGRTATVWYGAGTTWAVRSGVSGSIGCNNAVFGDPAPGIFKSCRFQASDTAPANQAPTVSVAAPASVVAGTAVTLTATAADADGTVARVEFFAGTTLLGSDTTAPYALGWTPTAAGSVAVTARAVDNAGAATTSAAVTVTVTAAPPPAQPPASAVSCATEGGTCTIPAGRTATVWYGAGTTWAVRSGVSGSIGCNNAVFGDPIPGIFKTCRFQ